jgi:hypothetical protein
VEELRLASSTDATARLDDAAAESLARCVQAWRADADATQARVADARRVRAQLCAMPPYRAVLAGLRAAADEAADRNQALSDCKGARDALSASADLLKRMDALRFDRFITA